MPERIQRRRLKGWRMPEGAIYVGRPSRFGNPWQAAREHGLWTVRQGDRDCWVPVPLETRAHAGEYAVQYFRSWLLHDVVPGHTRPRLQLIAPRRQKILDALPELRGHDLACWCPLDDGHGRRTPCHADVLLELANGKASA